jgi:hypothetical protein
MVNELEKLVSDFAGRLTSVIEGEALEKARRNVLAAFGVGAPRPVGRPPKARSTVTTKARKKPPLQLCPVPGCRNPAAPVFGMVCAKHKDVPKAKIKAYREARRAKKAKGSVNGVRRRKRRSAKRAVTSIASAATTA